MKALEVLQYEGENFINNARDNNTYKDRTGNLRSSIGYIVLYDGIEVCKNIEMAKNGSDGLTGIMEAKSFAEEIAFDYPFGWVLVCFAGMNYAAAVESRGYDVISSAANKIDIRDYFNVEFDTSV